ncbi:MAG: hypothetical protein QUV05_13055 [Phycisphaerae bacterium]|nr:hypothetical protein [Phycisphaerae bacterium]
MAALVVMIGIVLGYVWIRYDAHSIENMDIQLNELYRAYAHYLRDHDGQLPDGFADLQGGGYLVAVRTGGRISYFGPAPRLGEFLPVYDKNAIDIGQFTLMYSGSTAALEVRPDGLYRIGMSEPLCFITPHRKDLVTRSRSYSLRVVQNIGHLARSEKTRPAIERQGGI